MQYPRRRIEFGADGIRGYAGEWPVLSPVMFRIGQAIGEFLNRRTTHASVVLGRDTRPSGGNLLANLAGGLMDQGVDVINLQVMTTPGVAFLTRRLGTDLGIVISASHNPLEMNGIKIVRSNGLRLVREEELEIEVLIQQAVEHSLEANSMTGSETSGEHLIDLYVQAHVEEFYQQFKSDSLNGLAVVLDCSNGAASGIAPQVFSGLGARFQVINDTVSGKSINYRCGSEFARENPACVAEIIQEASAQYCFAFDGDGDRLIVIDRMGNVFDGNNLLYTLSGYYHARKELRNNTVVTINHTNRGLEEALEKLSIRTMYTNNGDRHLEAALWGKNYLLGGEPGGNIIFNDGNHTAADAIYTALLLGGILQHYDGIALYELNNDLEESLLDHPQLTRSVDIHTILDSSRQAALQEEWRRREQELGEGFRIHIWHSTTETGKYRVLVEGSGRDSRAQVEATGEDLCRFVQKLVSGGKSTEVKMESFTI
jgi:phosphoglucosamine mutase